MLLCVVGLVVYNIRRRGSYRLALLRRKNLGGTSVCQGQLGVIPCSEPNKQAALLPVNQQVRRKQTPRAMYSNERNGCASMQKEKNEEDDEVTRVGRRCFRHTIYKGSVLAVPPPSAVTRH